MAAIRLLELLILLAILSGFLGMVLRRNLLLKVLSMDVMGSGVVALFVLVAARTGLRSPILSTHETAVSLAAIADPIPQGVILTAIVIGISIQALLLVVISRLASIDPVLDVASFESDAPATGGQR